MSKYEEYVCTYYPDNWGEKYVPHLGEPIVRCRDCKYMFDWAYDVPMCKLWAHNDPDDSDASSWDALYPIVKPDGFCAWAVRRTEGANEHDGS